MSTLPALIDELRKSEREWYGSNMFELARMCRDAADMLEENAKLRELVQDMLACINNVSAHDTYCWDYCDFCKMYITKGRCDFESRMRELGVDA